MTDEPTDLDLVTDHPYKPSLGYGRDDGCAHDWAGWPCGYSAAEHAEPTDDRDNQEVP